MSATLEVPIGIHGLTATVSLFADGNDATVSACSGASLTEATNRTGLYTVAVTGLTGVYFVIAQVGGVDIWTGWVLMAASGTCTADESRQAVLALPNVAQGNAGAVLTSGTGTAQLNVSSGKVAEVTLVDTLTTYTGDTPQSGDTYARLGAPSGASVSVDIAAVNAKTTNLPAAPASTTNITAGTITTTTNLTNAPTNGDLTTQMKASVTAAVPTVAQNQSGLATSSALATVQTTVNAVGAEVVALGSPMQAYTQPTGFLASTFPATVASPTNITAGTITTVTNLTNAPTAGDFTPTMKSSIAAAVWNAATASYVTAGTFGLAVGTILGKLTGITYLKNWLGMIMGTGADSGTLAEINATASGVTYDNVSMSEQAIIAALPSGGGNGNDIVTITVTDNATPTPNPLQNAYVQLTMNSSAYIKATNSSGVAQLTPNENDGTYGVSIACGGYQFTPTTLPVVGNTSHTYQMTPISIPTSTPPEVTGYLTCLDGSGNPLTGVAHTLQAVSPAYLTTGTSLYASPVTVNSGSGGVVSFTGLVIGVTYKIQRGSGAFANFKAYNQNNTGFCPMPDVIG